MRPESYVALRRMLSDGGHDARRLDRSALAGLLHPDGGGVLNSLNIISDSWP